MEKVRRLIEAGARAGVAIREVLLVDRDLTVATFAEKYELPEKSVSNAINANVRPTDALAEALSTELGGTADEWKMLLWEAARPSVAA
jgi:plasmid maintenance system antidote protein VapI